MIEAGGDGIRRKLRHLMDEETTTYTRLIKAAFCASLLLFSFFAASPLQSTVTAAAGAAPLEEESVKSSVKPDNQQSSDAKEKNKKKKNNDVFIDTDPLRSGNEPSIAAHPTNTSIVLAFHKGTIEFEEGPPIDRTCDLHRSTDGGKTWSAPLALPVPDIDFHCTDPVIRWAPGDGADEGTTVRAYAMYMTMRENFSTADIVVSHSDDEGLTWSDPAIAIAGTEGVNFPDKPWVATNLNFPSTLEDNDIVYVTTTIYDGENVAIGGVIEGCRIVFAKSDDGAESFPDPLSPTILRSEDGCMPEVQGSAVSAGPDNSVLVCWFDSTEDGVILEDGTPGGVFDIVCRSSLDGGENFGDQVIAVDDRKEVSFWKCPDLSYHRITGAVFPRVEITHDGFAHMVYAADPTNDEFDSECGDVYYAKAAYPWDEWTPTELQQRVNDDSTATFQGFAAIASKNVDGKSILIVAWEDDRNSKKRSPNLTYDIYATTIDADGNIASNQRLTDKSSSSDFTFAGDYIDISVHQSAVDEVAYIIWTDRRDKSDILDPEDDVAMQVIRVR